VSGEGGTNRTYCLHFDATIWNGARRLLWEHDLQKLMLIAVRRRIEYQFRLKESEVRVRYEG
jgi:hypothetical protein